MVNKYDFCSFAAYDNHHILFAVNHNVPKQQFVIYQSVVKYPDVSQDLNMPLIVAERFHLVCVLLECEIFSLKNSVKKFKR